MFDRLKKLSLVMLFASGTVGAWGQSYQIKVTNLDNEALANVPITFAHPFLEGDVSATSFSARVQGSNQLIPLQTDVKARHSDGSLRHAVFSLLLPSLEDSGKATIELIPNNGTSQGLNKVSLQDLKDSGVSVEVAIDIEGSAFSATLDDVIDTPTKQWLDGATSGEWIFTSPLKGAEASSKHPHLSARFYVRKYSNSDNLKIDVVIENNWTFVSSPSDFTYDVDININGSSAYSFDDLTHFSHARWRKTFWSQGEPLVHIAHDSEALIDSKAVPSYDKSLIGKIDTSLYQSIDYNQTVTKNGRKTSSYSPMGIGLAEDYMPSTGGRIDIGPLPAWHVSYLLQQDVATKRIMLEMGDTGGSWPIHYREKATMAHTLITDWPNISLHPNSRNKPPACVNACNSPYTPDTAHQPSVAYLPYLVTGDYFYLEELLFWVNYNMISGPEPAEYRNHDKGLYNYGQDREMAWNMREHARAAFITPDSHEMKQYLEKILADNISAFSDELMVQNNNVFGALKPLYSQQSSSRPWMDDFFTWSMGQLIDLGYTEAKALADWKSRYSILRMGYGAESNEYCWIMASSYDDSPINEAGDFYNSINEMWSANFGELVNHTCNSQAFIETAGLSQVGEMAWYASSAIGIPSILQAALATAVDLNVDDANAAWDKFMSRSVKPDYTKNPVWALAPRKPKLIIPPSPPSVLLVQ